MRGRRPRRKASRRLRARTILPGGSRWPGDYIVADTSNRQLLRIAPTAPYTSVTVGGWTLAEGSVQENAYVRVDGSGHYILTVDDQDVNNDAPALRVFTSTSAGPLVPL